MVILCVVLWWIELRAVFSVFDVDHDGFITVQEVFKVLESMGFLPSPASIDDIFRQVDLDGIRTSSVVFVFDRHRHFHVISLRYCYDVQR